MRLKHVWARGYAHCASSTDVCPLHAGGEAASAASAAKPLEWDAEYWGEELEQFFACWGRVGHAVMAQENARRLERGP